MWLFRKERQHLRIEEVRATRAVMVLNEETQECNVSLVTEDGDRLDLTLPDRILPDLVMDLIDVYEAIHPPLKRGTRQATWMGMRN
jgi:hypothetical protein